MAAAAAAAGGNSNFFSAATSFSSSSRSELRVAYLPRITFPSSAAPFSRPSLRLLHLPPLLSLSSGSGGGSHGKGGNGGGKGDGGGGGDEEDGRRSRSQWEEIAAVLGKFGRTTESLPEDIIAAVKDERIAAESVRRFLELEKSPFYRWLMQIGGFKERLLADDLFLAKVAMECGVGIFTKTAAEYEKRKENFVKELDFVIADVVMAIVADFMLVWLPAPTVPLRQASAISAGPIAKIFSGCPDNAFQIVMPGHSYTFLQRIGAIVRNGSKLFVVGTSASLIGTGVTNALIKARKAVDKDFAGEVEDIPIISTSAAYGVYMAVSSNLRYQILAGVIEQRILEPLLHNQKALLGAMCFAVRTGNTYLGSLLWVDYARWVGVQ